MATKWIKPNCKPDFNIDLSRGKAGEQLLADKFPNLLIQLHGTGPDFRILGSQTYLELKTDSYNMNSTPNFFLETESRPGHPGGPFQALAKGSKYFIYYYLQNDKYFIFDTQDLVFFLKQNGWKYGERTIANKNYATKGLLIPRKDLESLNLNFSDIGLQNDY